MCRNVIVIITLLLSALTAAAQQQIIDRVLTQLAAYPQEKTYVHTDAPQYAADERMWLKVYVVEALSHHPASESLYAYVDLISPDDHVLCRAKIVCRDGIYAGHLDIPSSAAPGNYYLRSYTQLSGNLPQYTGVKPILIGNVTQAGTAHLSRAGAHTGTIRFERAGESLRVGCDSADSLILVAHCRAYPFYIGRVHRDSPVTLHRDSLPQGVIQLLLFDRRSRLVDQRLVFSNNGREQVALTLSPDKPVYACGDKATLRLTIPDLAEGELADVSVSVRGVGFTPRRQSSIVAHLLLGTDVAGGVDYPELYMDNEALADSLLLGRTWERYDFERIFRGEYANPGIGRETTAVLSGRVRKDNRDKPVPGAQVSVIAPQVGWYASATADANGRFAIPNADFPDGTKYVIRAVNPKGEQYVELQMDEKDIPPFTPPLVSAVAAQTGISDMDTANYYFPHTIMLDNVTVSAIRREGVDDGNVFSPMADFSFGLQRIQELNVTCLHELLRRIPGVRVVNNLCYIRNRTSIYGDSPAVFAIDGVILDGEYDLDNILMQDVARVDVFKSGSVSVWGVNGGAGVISITTKTGRHAERKEALPNQKMVVPQGYEKPESFFDLTGLGRTLYWSESVTGDSLTIPLPMRPGRCSVTVEGVTTHGRLIHEQAELIVE